MKTIRRDWLRRKVEQGRVVMVESYHFDEMTGESRSQGKSIPCAIMPPIGPARDACTFDGTTCYLYPHDFSSGSGSAYESDGVITLHVHSNSNYTLRVLPEKA